jgi:hypothetical protein
MLSFSTYFQPVYFSVTEPLLASQKSGVSRKTKKIQEDTKVTRNWKSLYSTQQVIGQSRQELYMALRAARCRERTELQQQSSGVV